MKRSRDYALKERAAHRLKGCLRKQILKVASEQHSPTYFMFYMKESFIKTEWYSRHYTKILVGYDGVVHVIG